ncbi:MAG: hypothetical protein IJL30_07450 [Clostridia bacterium]|nr:hypothetical protein [Clostridia bacterium]
MNNETLNVYRPKLRNAFWAAGFAVIAVPAFIVLLNSVNLPSGTAAEKALNIAVFILSWEVFEMSLISAIHCFRNIFSGPSVVLTNEKLWVMRKGELAIPDIDAEKTYVDKNSVTFYGKDGSEIKVKSRMISIPVGTLAYAVKQRTAAVEKQTEGEV